MSSPQPAPDAPAPGPTRLSGLGLIILEAVPSFIRRFLPADAPAAVALLTASQAAAVELSSTRQTASDSPRARVHLERVRRELELYLRQRGAMPWAKDDPAALKVRGVGRTRPGQPAPIPRTEDYAPWLDSPDPVDVANALICLTHQGCYLLDRPSSPPKPPTPAETSAEPAPDCPVCGKPMALRTVRQGPRAGSRFWGCTSFPTCRGTKRHRADQPGQTKGQG